MKVHLTPFLAVACSLELVSSLAIPDTHVLNEKREAQHGARWVKRDTAIASDRRLPVRIGLKQNKKAQEQSHEWLMDVSNPSSANYGKHWSQEEVIKAFEPTEETVNVVKKWLTTVIPEDRITHTDNKAWLGFDASASELEKLVHAQYYEHDHPEKDFALLSTDAYHLPKHVVDHVDMITPGVKAIKVRSENSRPFMARPSPIFKPADRNIAKAGDDVSNCDQAITPACLQALYNFQALPHDQKVSPSNSLGVYEGFGAYSQDDLNRFYGNFTPYIPSGNAPILASIDGGKAPSKSAADGDGESNLDFDLAIPIVYPQTTTLYQVGSDSFFNEFLDAIDGSYCTSTAYGETGDDPNVDPTFPNEAYNHPHQCGVFTPTNVISVSYGGDESGLPVNYLKRQCDEWKKLGLQGVSVLFASGDNGVADSNNGCDGDNNNIFSPDTPADCPYITAVGATALPKGRSVNDAEVVANDQSEQYSSGGGFSNIFPVADYQSTAVSAYFNDHNPPYDYYTDGNSSSGGVYNRNGRGYPDVAANGYNIAVYSGGKFGLSGGTSASTPIFASLITRINEERIASGKGPVGFLNPTLYANTQMFHDIQEGHSAGCGTDGFSAVPGWDPVTGLGTPNYPALSKVFNALQ